MNSYPISAVLQNQGAFLFLNLKRIPDSKKIRTSLNLPSLHAFLIAFSFPFSTHVFSLGV